VPQDFLNLASKTVREQSRFFEAGSVIFRAGDVPDGQIIPQASHTAHSALHISLARRPLTRRHNRRPPAAARCTMTTVRHTRFTLPFTSPFPPSPMV
jgi:hypothetical protein